MEKTLDFYNDLSSVMNGWDIDQKFLHPFNAYTKAYNKVVSILEDPEDPMFEVATALYDIMKDVEFVRVVKSKKQFGSVSGATVKIDKNLLMKVYTYGPEDKARVILTLQDWVDGKNVPDNASPYFAKGEFDTYSVCWFKTLEELQEFAKHVKQIDLQFDKGYIVYGTNVGGNTLRFAVVQENKIPPEDMFATLDDAFAETSIF